MITSWVRYCFSSMDLIYIILKTYKLNMWIVRFTINENVREKKLKSIWYENYKRNEKSMKLWNEIWKQQMLKITWNLVKINRNEVNTMWSLVGSVIVSVVMDLIYIILKTNKLNMWMFKDLQLMKMWKRILRREKN